MILNWLKKKLGYHVCEEFTRWETRVGLYERPCGPGDGNQYFAGVKTIEFSRRWQERTCTICGKTQQRSMEL